MTSIKIPSNFIAQFLDGFRSIFNPKITREIFNSPSLGKIFLESSRLNLTYLLFVVILRHWVFLPIILSIFFRRFINNTLVNFSLIKVGSNENPFSQTYKSCGCDAGALLQASLASLAIFIANTVVVNIISYLPLFKLITWLGLSLVYGQSLLEIKLSSAGMCTRHRSEVLIKNNGYSIGIGLALFWIINLCSSLIYNFTGTQGFFVNDAIFSLIYPYFIMVILIREKPFPSDCPSIDFFDYNRKTIPPMIKSTLKFWARLIKSTAEGTNWPAIYIQFKELIRTWTNIITEYCQEKIQPFQETLTKLELLSITVNYLAIVFRYLAVNSWDLLIKAQTFIPLKVQTWILDKIRLFSIKEYSRLLLYDPFDDWRYWKIYKICPSLIIFVETYGKPIKDKLKTLKGYTEYSSYIEIIPEALIKWLTSEDNVIIIKIIVNKQIIYPLDVAIEFIEDLEKVHQGLVKVTIYSKDISNLVNHNYIREEKKPVEANDEDIDDFESIPGDDFDDFEELNGA